MAELMPCPCGETPSRLLVDGDDYSDAPKFARVSGSCCGEWEVHFRHRFERVGSEASNALALAAWNAAPRAKP